MWERRWDWETKIVTLIQRKSRGDYLIVLTLIEPLFRQLWLPATFIKSRKNTIYNVLKEIRRVLLRKKRTKLYEQWRRVDIKRRWIKGKTVLIGGGGWCNEPFELVSILPSSFVSNVFYGFFVGVYYYDSLAGTGGSDRLLFVPARSHQPLLFTFNNIRTNMFPSNWLLHRWCRSMCTTSPSTEQHGETTKHKHCTGSTIQQTDATYEEQQASVDWQTGKNMDSRPCSRFKNIADRSLRSPQTSYFRDRRNSLTNLCGNSFERALNPLRFAFCQCKHCRFAGGVRIEKQC